MAEDTKDTASGGSCAGRLERTYRLALSLDSRMTLRFGWGDENTLELQADLVGYVHYEYLLVHVQPSPGLLPRIKQGELVHARFLNDGEAAIFQTEILGHLSRPSIVLALAYPQTMNTMQVRKYKRVSCALPVRVVKNDKKISGIISDLSRGGCRLLIDVRGQGTSRSICVGDAVSLVVPLDIEKSLENIQAIVKNIETEQYRLIMGLSFNHVPNRTEQLIENFLANAEILLS